MLISLQDLSKSFGSDLIFSGVTAKIEDSDRIGLVGANGAGKTTLLNILVGLSEPDKGELLRGSNLSIGYQRQNSGLCQTNTIIDEMRSVFADVYLLEQQLQQIRVDMSTAPDEQQQELGERYHLLEDSFLARDGYQVGVKISTVLTGMGFIEHSREKTIDKLSGGEQTRLAIAKLLLEQPSLLVLDEPTNHLDFKTLGWLEDYLSGYRGALLIVSHDRYFLDRLCNRIWEMERGEMSIFLGNYSRYIEQREERGILQQKMYDQQQDEIAKLKDFIARNLARASTTKLAQSRRRQLEKMEVLDRPNQRLKPPVIRLEYATEPVKDLLAVEQLSVAVGEGETRKTLISGLDLSVARGDRVAIIGGNGTGKTSLLRALLGGSTKAAGRVEWGRGVKHSFYSQGSENLDQTLTVLDTMWQYYPRSYETVLRSMLGALGLSGEDAFKRVGQLSGGERARLKLAIICLAGSNTLILDEPTNHLDLATKEVLEQALCSFTGTIIMVSHDRYLLDRLPNRIIELENGTAIQYKGRYSDYLALKSPTLKQAAQKPAEAQDAQDEAEAQKTAYHKGKETRREDAQRRREYAETEALIATLEEQLARTEFQLTEPETMADYILLQELLDKQRQMENDLSRAMTRWVELAE